MTKQMEGEKFKYKFVLSTGDIIYQDSREALEDALLKDVKIISQEKIE